MSLRNQTLQQFLEAMAGSSATPGGGSASALSGAMGAALLHMVCGLTVGKERFAGAEGELRAVLQEADALRQGLTDLAEADTRAFDGVMAAYRMPKTSDAEKSQRQEAIQAALRRATQVPLETAIACSRVVRLVAQVVDKINPNALSDAGAAALLAEAGLRGAKLNVKINVTSIQDTDFVQQKEQALEQALAGAEQQKEKIFRYVLTHIT
jgi:formiminotetrahydrofolate cyclodeaminase